VLGLDLAVEVRLLRLARGAPDRSTITFARLPHTDAFVAYWLCNPYALQFHKSEGRHAIRWFVR